jgi:hypothetical protein
MILTQFLRDLQIKALLENQGVDPKTHAVAKSLIFKKALLMKL